MRASATSSGYPPPISIWRIAWHFKAVAKRIKKIKQAKEEKQNRG
jgi:hypothetical protein